MRRASGTTMLELLIGSALLLLLTGILFQTVVPVMRESSRVDAKQENLQRLILLREYVNKRLRSSKVTRVTATAVEFYQPDLVDTSVGQVPRINEAEMVDWDEATIYEIKCLPSGEVIDQGRGKPLTRRVLWNLGKDGTLRFEGAALPLLEVEVSTKVKQPDATEETWIRRFPIVLSNYRR